MDLTENDLGQQIKAACNHILQETTQIRGKATRDNYEPIIEQIKIIEQIFNYNSRYYALFSQTKFFPIYR